jgi:hypothetical protein
VSPEDSVSQQHTQRLHQPDTLSERMVLNSP